MILLLTTLIAALACDDAERLRLEDEGRKLAGRNAWAGVERAYEGLVATRCPLGFDQHFLGAQSARYLGKTLEVSDRLRAAAALDPRPDLDTELSALDENYGRVELKGDARHPPSLTRAAMPFAPDQRKSIEWATQVIVNTGSFRGMLPLGDYTVGGKGFTVVPGNVFQIIEAGKVKAETPDADRGLVHWSGLVLSGGPALVMSSASTDPVLDASGRQQFAPDDLSSVGAGIRLGGEVGLTWAKPELGVAAALGWSAGFGDDTLHVVTVDVGALLRPGNLRFTLGPSWALMSGRGTGVAPWFDVGQNADVDPNAEILYQGSAWGPGIHAAAGVGLLDLGDRLQGLVELGGSWHGDGARGYVDMGLRLGIIPVVPRFEG